MTLKINAENAPKAIGPYSHAIQANGFIFVSGQLPIDPETGKITGFTIEGQTIQVLKNIKAILNKAGIDFEDVIKTEIFVKDINDIGKINEIYGKLFTNEKKPSRQLIQAAKLPMDSLIEISCIAFKNK